MVQLQAVVAANDAFERQKHADAVCVFEGATSGIGAATMERMASLLTTPTFYVVGRSQERFQEQRKRLQKCNPECKVHFILAEISLISGVDAACQQILEATKRVDYLCMSSGYLPLAGAIMTKEGLEQCFVLSYYARLRFVNNLLPLLRNSPSPRVLSILNGGKEKAFATETDLGLKDNWGILNLVGHSTTMGTLAFYHLSEQEKNITFIHTSPGLVRTDISRKPKPGPSSSIFYRLFVNVMRFLMRFVLYFKSTEAEASGQRHAYVLTDEKLKPGVWRINEFSDQVPESAVLEKYRETGWPSRIWDFTVQVWNGALER